MVINTPGSVSIAGNTIIHLVHVAMAKTLRVIHVVDLAIKSVCVVIYIVRLVAKKISPLDNAMYPLSIDLQT
jgi:hypothetical protein